MTDNDSKTLTANMGPDATRADVVKTMDGHILGKGVRLDHHIPEDQRQAVVKGVGDAGKSFVDVTFSNADHGFFCDAQASYQPAAAAQAWSLTQAFFDTYCPR